MDNCTHLSEDGKRHLFNWPMVPHERNVWNPFEPTCSNCGRSIGEIIKARLPEAFTPTHEHADGGKYEMLGHGKNRNTVNDAWEAAVFYRNAEGMLFSTSLLRWNARFTPSPHRRSEGVDPAEPRRD